MKTRNKKFIFIAIISIFICVSLVTAVTYATTIGTDVSVSGNLNITGTNLQATSGTLNVSRAGSTTTIRGALNVDQAATFDTTVGVTGNTTLSGNLIVGNADTDSITGYGTTTVRALNATSTVRFDGHTTIGSNATDYLWVNAVIPDDNTLIFGNDSDTYLQYDEDGRNVLQITGNTLFDNNLYVNGMATTTASTGKIATAGDLSVGGNATTTGEFVVSGNTTLGSDSNDIITFNAKAASDLDMNSYAIENLKEVMEIRNAAEFVDGSSTAGIQEAINDLPNNRGMVYIPAGNHTISSAIALDGTSGITLMGAGQKTTTLLLPNDATNNLIEIGGNTGIARNIFIKDLRLEGNKDNVTDTVHGIYIRSVGGNAGNLYINNLYIQSFTGSSIKIETVDDSIYDLHFTDVITESSDLAGWHFYAPHSVGYNIERWFIEGGYSFDNKQGMLLEGRYIYHGQISNYDFENNEEQGVLIRGAKAITISGGHVIKNSQSASGTYAGIRFENDDDGYQPMKNLVNGVNFYQGRPETQKYAVYFASGADDNVVKGSQLSGGFTDAPFGAYHVNAYRKNYPEDKIKKTFFKNNSGSDLSAGDIVILDTSDSDLESFATTTTGNDPKVTGVLADDIDAGNFDEVILEGPVHNLHVNGTTDIAIGDFIGTYTEAGIGQKCTPGSGACIAIAYEAYTANDSNGSIKAMIIRPR